MLRLRITDLLATYNEGRPAEERLTVQHVADAIGVSRGTLAPLSSFNRRPVTNTATLEALLRYFTRLIPNFTFADLIEFDPPLSQTQSVVIDELYPDRAARRAREEGTTRTRGTRPRRPPAE